MTQMTEGPPPITHDVAPGQQWAQADQHWSSPEQQWTDWGRSEASGSEAKPGRGFPRAVLVPLGVFTALAVITGLFLMVAAPAGAVGCGGG